MSDKTETPTPLTDAAFEKADNNNSPQFGEGWEGFADSIKLDMQNLERQLAEARKDTERFQSVDPIEEWMEEQFPELWKDFKTHAKAFCEEGDARYFAMAFRNAMKEESK